MPQLGIAKATAARLSTRPDVAALWLSGSLARGEADVYSDIDLHVAVDISMLPEWRTPNLVALGVEAAGAHLGVVDFGEYGLLHQIVLTSGDILDLLIHSATASLPQGPISVLYCRDPGLAERLASVTAAPPHEPPPADPGAVRQAIVDFWISSLKHTKVLARGLDAMAQVGLVHERTIMLRLWSIDVLGVDHGHRGTTIHALTPIVRAVASSQGERALALLGAPLRTREELVVCIEANRDEVAAVGRRLSDRLGFEYPSALEKVVRDRWACVAER